MGVIELHVRAVRGSSSMSRRRQYVKCREEGGGGFSPKGARQGRGDIESVKVRGPGDRHSRARAPAWDGGAPHAESGVLVCRPALRALPPKASSPIYRQSGG